MRAWGRMFGEFLASRAAAPYADADYFAHIDGKPRLDGVRAMLASRGHRPCPRATPDDDPGARDRRGPREPQERGVHGRARGARRRPVPRVRCASWRRRSPRGSPWRSCPAPATPSPCCAPPASATASRWSWTARSPPRRACRASRRPTPTSTRRAARARRGRLRGGGGRPLRGPGGRAAGFGLVVGVDRGAGALELLASGADLVVDDLAELIPGLPRLRGPRVNRITSDPLDRGHFPVDEWALRETEFDQRRSRAARRRCSPSATAISACAGNMEEGRDGHATARSSTASTRPGRSATPRRPTASRAWGRRSSTSPTRRSSASTSTTSRWWSARPSSSRTRGCSTSATACSCASWSGARRPASACASAPGGWCRSPSATSRSSSTRSPCSTPTPRS